ncbi:S8 family serine peptidase [Brumimicrobium sp.]|uniref:S8 family serine peptidase n=1 Tax=Brumimicrobium sp. TaxID=2029867 RepID=UPI003A8F43F4
MRFKLMMFLSVFLFSSQWAKTQNYYEHYQDGLVVFQLKLQSKKMLSKDKQVNFKDYPLFTEYLSDFEIVEVKHLHPELDDDLLNRTYQIKLNDWSKVDALVKKLSRHSMIEYAELKDLHRKLYTPNDALYGVSNQWGLFTIEAEQAWDISLGNSNVVVAVTDDAMQLDHPDLQNVFVTGRDMHDNDNTPSPCGSTDGMHGTHVSGTVGAQTNNGIGLASIGAGVSVMPIKISDCGGGNLPYGYDGVVWAANNGADIINMSWGGPTAGSYGQNVMNNAWNQGVILVAAAGNDGVSTMFYPAAYNNVISVANTTENDTKANSSQYGTWIDIAAPGSNIASTVPSSSYAYLTGTSMASPLVSGLLGLMKSYAPSATNTELINCLLSSADPINDTYYNNGQLGSGRINAHEALLCLTGSSVQLDASISDIYSPSGTICSPSFMPQIELSNYGTTTLTSAVITYDWGGAPQTFNWSGNLPSGQTTTVTLPTGTATNGSYVFSATVSSPNGQVDEDFSNNTFSSNFTINSGGQQAVLYLDTDCWGSETTWEILDGNNVVVASGGPYTDVVGGTFNTHNLCLPVGCYTFNIFDQYGDGMSGAQYQSCSTNGDYEMHDADGTVLFQMAEPDGNFGASANHSFCITASNTTDAGIEVINSPAGIVCASTISPEVELRNYGSQTLTSVEIAYEINGNQNTYSWTGSLASGQAQTVTLPVILVGTGPSVLTITTQNPNGGTDDDPSNDEQQNTLILRTTSAALPFVEDFENNATGWLVSNPDGDITWSLASIGGTSPGNTAIKLDYFNYQNANQRDGLISPKIDLTGLSSAEMYFEHAFRRYDVNSTDSLIIYISTDCADTWTRIAQFGEDGTGSFATQTTTTTEFVPSAANDWCIQPINQSTPGASCFTINLDSFVGNEVFIMFESYKGSTYGNNLYLDNINIDGVAVQLAPEPGLSASSSVVCEGETVYYTDQSTNQPTSWNWTFPGGSPSTSTLQNPVVTYPTSGTYNVTLQASNAYGTQTMTFSNQITVNGLPQVNATAVDMTICSGASTSISASGASSYSWNNGLGGGSTHTVSPTTTTTYQVTGTSGNCSNTASVEVVVSPPINVGVTASATEVCAGSSVSLSASGASTYTWNNGLGSGNTQTDSPTQTTVYTVTGTEGNCSNSASITIVVNDVPVVQVSAINTTICEGENTTMNASGADTYAWTPSGSLNTSSGASVVASPSATTTYSVMGSNNCGIDTETIVINVNASPGQPTISQVGNVLSTNLQTGETAQWFLNGALVGSGASITMTQDGNYEVVITNANGCSASANGNFVRDTTGLTQNELNKHLKVYPNPTENTVHVSWEGAELIEKIVVYDAIGRAVIKLTDVNDKTEMLDFTSFETGVYIVRIETASNTISRKITKR